MTYNAEINPLACNSTGSAYKGRLNRWAIARVMSGNQLKIVARFRNRSDADGHLQILRQQFPDNHLIIIVDPQEG
jgi:hypothetical protein